MNIINCNSFNSDTRKCENKIWKKRISNISSFAALLVSFRPLKFSQITLKQEKYENITIATISTKYSYSVFSLPLFHFTFFCFGFNDECNTPHTSMNFTCIHFVNICLSLKWIDCDIHLIQTLLKLYFLNREVY